MRDEHRIIEINVGSYESAYLERDRDEDRED